MASYRFAGIFSLGAILVSALSACFAWGPPLVRRVADAFDFAFPIAAVRDRMPIEPQQSEAVTYATGLSRARAFRARLVQRLTQPTGFGVLGLPAAA